MIIILKILSIIGIILFGIFTYCLCALSSEFSRSEEEGENKDEKD